MGFDEESDRWKQAGPGLSYVSASKGALRLICHFPPSTSPHPSLNLQSTCEQYAFLPAASDSIELESAAALEEERRLLAQRQMEQERKEEERKRQARVAAERAETERIRKERAAEKKWDDGATTRSDSELTAEVLASGGSGTVLGGLVVVGGIIVASGNGDQGTVGGSGADGDTLNTSTLELDADENGATKQRAEETQSVVDALHEEPVPMEARQVLRDEQGDVREEDETDVEVKLQDEVVRQEDEEEEAAGNDIRRGDDEEDDDDSFDMYEYEFDVMVQNMKSLMEEQAGDDNIT